jgi:uncharacterized protein YkwD
MNRPNSYLALTVAVILSLVLASGATASTRTSTFNPRGVTFNAEEIAPPATCPGQTAEGLSGEEQVGVMLCMTNYARSFHGLGTLRPQRKLQRAAEQKSTDILGCDEFSHEACGRPFTFWDQRFGYLKGCWKAGENIAWGTGTFSTVRAIFTAWLESPEHHENILGPYKEIGIAFQVGDLEGNPGAVVWTQDFGSHKC